MSKESVSRWVMRGCIPFIMSICVFILAACGNNATTATGSPAATATSANCPPQEHARAVTGTVQSVNGNTVQLTTHKGKSVKVMLADTTRITRQNAATTSALQSGAPVSIAVDQGQNNTYTATKITLVLRNNNTGTNTKPNKGKGQKRNPACAKNGGGANGNGGNNANGNGGTVRAINGTIGQVNGNTITVTDAKGDDYTVTVNSTTKIIQTTSATAGDIKQNTDIAVTGMPESDQSTIDARQVVILLPTTPNK